MFEYGNPDAILADMLQHPLTPDDLGHTVLDDFEHFCAYTGCNPERIGAEAFAWAKLAYVSAHS
ncbi:hypothetical protein PPGU19_012260 [Paraburkholderia sp. PGU19]|uniref:hypothetical protein n=1 Tax=unclassified Paraburkholderia TaxID=2615204 RepID=UPI0015D98624|nr:hypothetical protein [Paraburkholderia sp. PGU19]BCF96657.1 hypothetical protein PPGU19_012260 [Paraburkholderia sp. PGU19]